jgi:glutamate/tyrosine decarboxylase-like PLP-dependent enzyme
LVTAREAAGNPVDPVVYVSDQGHSSLERAARIAGIPAEGIRRISTDCFFRMNLDALEEAITDDLEAGRTPLCICGTAGATNTGAIDPLDGIADLAEREDVWFHVDGAYGGFAVLVPEEAESFRGLERADSVTLDPHKWLFQSYETGCLMVRNTEPLEAAFRILPEYLQDTDLGREQVNFADRGVQLSRSFRALKIWMSIQTLGLGAFRDTIRQGITLARKAEAFIQSSPRLEMLGPSALGIVCFRYQASGSPLRPEALEELNQAIQDEVVSRGLGMMSSTRLRGTFSLRLCIMNYRSTWDDVLGVLERLVEVGGRLSGSGGTHRE